MKMRPMARALVGFALVLPCSARVSAVQKVIQMLTDMTAKAKAEVNEEQVAFAEFETWCSQESANLKTDIKKGAEAIGSLTASIGMLSSDISSLSDRFANLQDSKAKSEADLAASRSQREKDHADFLVQEKDYAESVDAIERALVILSKQAYDRTSEAALLQASTLKSLKLPEKAQSMVTAFIGMRDGATSDDPNYLDYSAPEANAYEFQSGNIVDLLKKLRDEFRSKLADCQKEEMNSKQAANMIEQDLTDSIENAAKESGEVSMLKDNKVAKRAGEEKQLQGETKVKAQNEEALTQVTTECQEKKFSFQEKQQLRAEEIEAMGKAIEILSSDAVLGSAEKHLSLLEMRQTTSLVQFHGAAFEQHDAVNRRLQDFLRTEGRRLHSDRLTLLAQTIAADPFAKVKKLIDDLITRLLNEANVDANHEGFCDTEMGKSKVTRDKLSSSIESLTAAIEEGKANILELTEDTKQLSQEIADLDVAMKEATKLRQQEKATNEETVKDAKAGQEAVAAATAVLKDFYAKASTATAFLQVPTDRQWGLKTRVKMGSDEWNSLANPKLEGTVDTGHKEGMQTFGEADQGQQDEAGGVLALMEVIASDFANLEAQTTAAETAAEQTYQRFMVESQKGKAVKTKKVDMNEVDRLSAESKLSRDTADLKATQDQLLAANRYHETLVPQCIDRGMTWDQRVAARKAEIASLKEALHILSNEDVA